MSTMVTTTSLGAGTPHITQGWTTSTKAAEQLNLSRPTSKIRATKTQQAKAFYSINSVKQAELLLARVSSVFINRSGVNIYKYFEVVALTKFMYSRLMPNINCSSSVALISN